MSKTKEETLHIICKYLLGMVKSYIDQSKDDDGPGSDMAYCVWVLGMLHGLSENHYPIFKNENEVDFDTDTVQIVLKYFPEFEVRYKRSKHTCRNACHSDCHESYLSLSLFPQSRFGQLVSQKKSSSSSKSVSSSPIIYFHF